MRSHREPLEQRAHAGRVVRRRGGVSRGRFTSLEMGSDIGGSIRKPAHFCGVFGHKRTWNLLPRRGHALGGVLTDGSPVGLRIIGPAHGDLRTIGLAQRLQRMASPSARRRVSTDTVAT